MQTITLLITQAPNGEPFYQVIPSDGIDPQQGIQACWRGISAFQGMLIEAEVQRRLGEMDDGPPLEPEEESDDPD